MSSEGSDGKEKTLKLKNNHTGADEDFNNTHGKITLTLDESTLKHPNSVIDSLAKEK